MIIYHGSPQIVKKPDLESGIEPAREVIFITTGQTIDTIPNPRFERSSICWAGWALAYFQWYSGNSFEKIYKVLPFSKLMKMYPTLHEAVIKKFVSVADGLLSEDKNIRETNLSQLRKARGFSQRELSDTSGVSLRMIQLYVQKRNDINKVQAASLYSLAQALCCKIEDLFD